MYSFNPRPLEAGDARRARQCHLHTLLFQSTPA